MEMNKRANYEPCEAVGYEVCEAAAGPMHKAGFIGMGNMGGAILRGLLKQEGIRPEDLIFTAAHPEKMDQVTRDTGVAHGASNADCVKMAEYVILAVKPQYFDAVFQEINGVLRKGQIVISLAPGLSIQSLKERMGGEVRVVRAMPNTPAMLGEGMTGIAFGTDRYEEREKQEILKIFEACGRVREVEERQMDAVGCVSGCSPAFVYMFIEALADSGVKYGLPRAAAYEMAAQAVAGSARMVLETGIHPGQLKDQVCSPGGTTIAGVSALEEHGFRSAVIKAADACYEKSQRMK